MKDQTLRQQLPANLSDKAFLQDSLLRHVLSALCAEGGEARVAGGAVRNALLDLPVRDVDIATTETPDRVTTLMQRAGLAVYPTGVDHGTVTVVATGEGRVRSFEITTLRRDIETDGRHAKVSFTKDWTADAQRRDFTINALYCDLRGEVLDPLGGYDDLLARRVRFVGNAVDRIREDYLRILRFFRFHAQFASGRPDREGLAAAVEMKEGARGLSGERVAAEMKRILIAPRGPAVLRIMARRSILSVFVPGPFDVPSVERMSEIDVVQYEVPDPVLRLAALTRAAPGKLKEALKLTNGEFARLVTLDHVDDVSPDLSDHERRVKLYQLCSPAFRDAVRLSWARAEAAASDAAWKQLLDLASAWPIPSFPVTGADLLARGYEPGPEVGSMLLFLESWWCKQGFVPDKVAILEQLDPAGRGEEKGTEDG